jgi:UDP-N-acetylmuramate dehydrogenase
MIPADARSELETALGERVRFDVPLSRHTSLRVGGPADALATPANREELAATLAICARHDIDHTVLGAGFNALVVDAGLAGVVIRLNRWRALEARPDCGLYAQAGASHSQVTNFCVEHGLSGLEFGCGIPGSVGGWIAMNAGIPQREIGDVVCSVEVMDARGDEVRQVPAAEFRFAYRAVPGLAPGALVLSVLFSLSPSTQERVRAAVDDLLAKRSASQPLNVPTCGSVFVNPEGDHAGRLIEAAGLKGRRIGGAEISTVHANFITNRGDATAGDVLALIQETQKEVFGRTGVRLVPEVRILGRAA